MTSENSMPGDVPTAWHATLKARLPASEQYPEKLELMALMATQIAGGYTPQQVETTDSADAVLQIIEAATEVHKNALEIQHDAAGSNGIRYFGKECWGNPVFDQRLKVAALRIAMKRDDLECYKNGSLELKRKMLNEKSAIDMTVSGQMNDLAQLENAAQAAFLLGLLNRFPAAAQRKVPGEKEQEEISRIQRFAKSEKPSANVSNDKNKPRNDFERQREMSKKTEKTNNNANQADQNRQNKDSSEQEASNTDFTKKSKGMAKKLIGGGVIGTLFLWACT